MKRNNDAADSRFKLTDRELETVVGGVDRTALYNRSVQRMMEGFEPPNDPEPTEDQSGNTTGNVLPKER